MIIYIYFQLFVFISQTAPAQQNTPYFHFTQKQTYISPQIPNHNKTKPRAKSVQT